MCGRTAVIRAGHGLARAVGARRIIHDQRSARGGAGGGAGAGAGAGGGAGFFADGGAVGSRRDAAPVNDAAPAASTAASQVSAVAAAPVKEVSAFPSVDKPQAQAQGQTLSHTQAQAAVDKESTTQTATPTPTRTGYRNYNVGPTSTVPVWRLQTAAEQAELLKLEAAVSDAGSSADPRVKAEVDELAAEAIKAEQTHQEIQAVPVIHYMQWGFPNPFAGRAGDQGPGRSHVFNARSESVDEKRMFSGLIHKKRCIVLVDGFFEWHQEYSTQTGEAAKKQPYFFHMPRSDGATPTISVKKSNGTSPDDSPFPPMMMAGLYDASINDATGETTYCCVVLTCGPSKEMQKIHTRMPVILSPEDAAKWVNVDKYDFNSVKGLMKPYQGLCFYKVPTVVNNARNKGVECIEPLDEFEKRSKASGIGRFFSPVKPKPKSSPAPSSESKTAETAPQSVGASTAVLNSDGGSGADGDAASFFNTKGAPGRVFAPRINPADPGQTGGSQETATTAPASATSDAADAAVEFVKQVKEEAAGVKEEPAGGGSGDGDSGNGAAAPQKRKREGEQAASVSVKQEDEEADAFEQDEPSMPYVAWEEETEEVVQHTQKKVKHSLPFSP